MLSSFFSKGQYDLDGHHFKTEYNKSRDNVLLDVRTIAEYKSGSLSKALHADYFSPSFLQLIEQLQKDKTYFVFCRAGNRSSSAVNTMRKMGFNAYNLNGGIGEWPK